MQNFRPNFYKQRTIEFDTKTNSVSLIDQTLLPTRFTFVQCQTVAQLVHSIKTMQIRGAPAIGVAGAMGLALSFKENRDKNQGGLLAALEKDAVQIKEARPTAVNLAWGVDEALRFLKKSLAQPNSTRDNLYRELVTFVRGLADKDISANKTLSNIGATLLRNNARVLTHCK